MELLTRLPIEDMVTSQTELPRLAVAGENIIDLVPDDTEPDRYSAIPGGSPANIAIAAHRLGTPSSLIARLSSDVFGRRIRQRLAADGVSDRYVMTAPEPSSLAVISFDDSGSAHYDFWVAGTADWEWSDVELPDPLGDDVGGLHVGSIAIQREPGGSSLLRFVRSERERGAVTISLDPNIRPPVIGDPDRSRKRTEEFVGLAHVVKVSDEDIDYLYPGALPLEVARRWLHLGPDLVAVTHGPDGAHAITASAETFCPSPAVDVVDTVGAGDAFMGALLHDANLQGMLGNSGGEGFTGLGAAGLEKLLRAACQAAAINCGRQGADAPTAADLARFT